MFHLDYIGYAFKLAQDLLLGTEVCFGSLCLPFDDLNSKDIAAFQILRLDNKAERASA